MRSTVAVLLAAGALGLQFAEKAGAEQDFRPIWCPQTTTYYIQLREALDPLRAATVAHDLDIAKAKRQGKKPARPVPAPNVNSNPDQPPFTEDGNPIRPRYSEPAQPATPEQKAAKKAADQAAAQADGQAQAAQPQAPAGPAPVKQWTWGDPEVQDAVDQFEEKSPLLFRRINTVAAMTWWAELQDAESTLGAKFAEILGDEREEVSAQDLTKDWVSLEEQYETLRDLCIGWGETAIAGVAPPGQPEWPQGSNLDTARPQGIENTAWPHTPGWVDVPVSDPDDPSAPPPQHRPAPPPADPQPQPLAHQGCERYDYRAGGWGQYPFCPGEGPDDGPEEPDSGEAGSDEAGE